jgi:ABC-type methionine transport system ATPase subunit
MIKLKNAHKYFGEKDNRLHVLKDIDLEIQKGEMAGRVLSSVPKFCNILASL